jgi:hypothetical protein
MTDPPVLDGAGPSSTSTVSVARNSGTKLLADVAAHLFTPRNLIHDAESAAARFDVSPFRLWLLFQSVDNNHDGYIDKEELLHALASASNQDDAVDSVVPDTITTSSPLHKTHLLKSKEGEENEEGTEEEDDDDEEDLEESLLLADIKALEELFEEVVKAGPADAESSSQSPIEPPDSDNEEKTDPQGNVTGTQPPRGITFPQFCRIVRYLWLQQLLNPELENKKDPNQHYKFECIDYASGYYRHRTLLGNSTDSKSRNFFTAPRHGHARMRWVDVPSGTFARPSHGGGTPRPQHYQEDSVRITILRLAVKYRFHPTSIEDAMDILYQEPKVNVFEHSLIDLGSYNCGTISWLRHAGHPDQNVTASSTASLLPTPPSFAAIPQPKKAQRMSSTQSFRSYHNDPERTNIPDFVLAEGESDIRLDEGRHYFITIPMFELSRRSETSLNLHVDVAGLVPMLQIQPLLIEVNEATLGIFVASQPDANLVVTCSTKWRSTRIKPFFESTLASSQNRRKSRKRRWLGGLCGWRRNIDEEENESASSSGSNGDNDDDDDDNDDDDLLIQEMLQDEKSSLERVKGLLRKRHSIQRHRNSNWLMHAIIDAVVDNLGPIAKIYEAQLQRMGTKLFELQHRLSRHEVKAMIVMKRDLEWLQRELRPLARVLRHLIDDGNIGTEVTHYLEDVEDHLLSTLEELSSHASECMTLKDEYNAYLDRRTNDILYILTLVTVTIVPGQLLVGYFGMNFENTNTGELGDPLLQMGSAGLGIFWGLFFASTIFVMLIMYSCNFFQKESVR